MASVGGFVKQYQVEVNPNVLASFGISLAQVRSAIELNNADVGGRLIEFAESEFMVRGRGYLNGIEDLKQIAVGTSANGIPLLLRDIATIQKGPELRRGLTDLDGMGDAPAGVVIMRFGENALETIERVKQKLKELEPGLPEGVEIVTVYDRSGLIKRAIGTLTEKLLAEIAIVAVICVVFLFHLRSALVAIVTLPLGILFSFIVMYHQGLNANIMSLGGIAIAIGVMVDAAIVMVENAHKHLERDQGTKPRQQILIEAAVQVGPSLFFSLLVVVVSFLPIFSLEAQEGRLFTPLAFTKTYAMLGAALLSITVVPLLMVWLIPGQVAPEARNPINRWIAALYRPVIEAALRHKTVVLTVAAALLITSGFPLQRLGAEFMPPLNEGDLLYMPSTTYPGVSITKMREILQQTDRVLMQFPEVKRVFGKAGRAETATDPAPLSMIETTIMLEPEENWRDGMTLKKLTAEMNQALQIPGLTNVWTMPIKTRIDMLATGIKTPVGIKISGSDLGELQRLGERIEGITSTLPGTLSVSADRVVGGNYLDFDIDRREIARYGLNIADVQSVIQSAIGGMNVTWSVEGRERYPINLRYPRELRDNLTALRRVVVSAPGGAQIPLGQLAQIEFRKGPASIKTENARLNAWVLIDLDGIDVGSWVARAKIELAARLELPPGYSISWSGEFEYMERAAKRLQIVVPITIGIIFLLLYMNFRRVSNTLIVMLTVPLSLVGGLWLLYWFDYNLSVAVGVGFIGLVGITTEIGVVLTVFLEESMTRFETEGRLSTQMDVNAAVCEGAVRRVRPVMMTITSTMAGLLPILWGSGAGSQTMSRIAAPMVGGLVSATVLALVVIPVVFALVRGWRLPEGEVADDKLSPR